MIKHTLNPGEFLWCDMNHQYWFKVHASHISQYFRHWRLAKYEPYLESTPPTQDAILANKGLGWDFLVYVMSSWWWLESWVPGRSNFFPVSQVSLHKLLLFDDAIHVGIKVLEPGFQHGSLLSNKNTSRVWFASHPKKKDRTSFIQAEHKSKLCGGRNHMVVASSLRFLCVSLGIPSVQIDRSLQLSTHHATYHGSNLRLLVVSWTIRRSTNGKLAVWVVALGF